MDTICIQSILHAPEEHLPGVHIHPVFQPASSRIDNSSNSNKNKRMEDRSCHGWMEILDRVSMMMMMMMDALCASSLHSPVRIFTIKV